MMKTKLRVIGCALLAAAGVAEAAPDGACANFYPAGYTLSQGELTQPWLTTEQKPVRGAQRQEPNWRTCTVRVTDHAADGVDTFARNDYSRRQAFNADNSREIVYANDGHWHLYNAVTYKRLKTLNGLAGDAEPQWDPLDPKTLYYLPYAGIGMKLFQMDITTNTTSPMHWDFAARLRQRWPTANAAWTKAEGSPSADGRYWCFMVDDANWNGLGVFTWDKSTDTILGMWNLVGSRPDHVSMSPSGNYCVVSQENETVFNRDMTNPRVLRQGAEHSDLAIGADGDDYMVTVDYGDGNVFMVNLRTLARTNLFQVYVMPDGSSGYATALHVSGKGYKKPGWVIVSTYAEGRNNGQYLQQWMHRKVFAVQMAANPRIYNLADTQNLWVTGAYFDEPHASVSADFSKIVFNSNWYNTVDPLDVDVYMVQIKPGLVK